MNKQVRHTINLVLAAVGLAMGVAVIVLTYINPDVSVNELINLLSIAVVSLGLFAINSISK